MNSLEFGTESVRVQFHPPSATFSLTDCRTGIIYEQHRPSGSGAIRQAQLDASGRAMTARLVPADQDLDLRLQIEVSPDRPEITCSLQGRGPISHGIAFPAPFRSRPGDFLALPVNEGMLLPVSDATLGLLSLPLYCGATGLSMSWCGLVAGEDGPGLMMIVETPDDALIRVERFPRDGRLCMLLAWEASRGEVRYARVVRYVLTDGGYVGQAKRYREHSIDRGLVVTLRQKLAGNANVDRLVGAPSMWFPAFAGWDADQDWVALAREIRALGIDRFMFSAGGSPETIAQLNSLDGVLTSRYDNYQDVWPAGADVPWRKKGWPEDIVLLPDGQPVRWWPKDPDDPDSRGGLLCSQRAVGIAREELAADLARTPYRARFIDTIGAMPWRECYHPEHPTTRGEDRHYKTEILRVCSQELGIVTGTEDGIDAVVPYAHFLEGMLSFLDHLLPACSTAEGIAAYAEPTPGFLRFQVGPYYRVPLWELVYRDCIQSTWWWGDSSGKVPEVWDRRDLLNLLYGTVPLFMPTPSTWAAHKQRYLQSYRTVCPFVRDVGYDEMSCHEFLTGDHTVQRTRWSSGRSVTVNFAPYQQKLVDGTVIPGLGHVIQ